ncbi:MAG: hypothetical protein M5U05_06835 [Anaerolineales bacterium]|nr:hypothetical protein [Anaerolineales bacterium]
MIEPDAAGVIRWRVEKQVEAAGVIDALAKLLDGAVVMRVNHHRGRLE